MTAMDEEPVEALDLALCAWAFDLALGERSEPAVSHPGLVFNRSTLPAALLIPNGRAALSTARRACLKARKPRITLSGARASIRHPARLHASMLGALHV